MSRRVDMLSGNIGSALIKLSIPLVASNIMNIAYNLIDTIWVGSLGAGAVTSVATAGMWLFLSQGMAMITQTGAQITVGQKIGEGKLDEARAISRAAIVMMSITMLFYLILVLVARREMVGVFGVSDENINQAACDYLLITGISVLFHGFNYIISSVYTAIGDSRTPFTYNSIGLLINVILDPILIFGWIGAPKLGVYGAGVASTIAVAIVSVIFLVDIVKDGYIFGRIEDPNVKVFNWYEIRKMIRLGIPPALQTILFSLVYMVIGRIVTSFGDTIYGIQRAAAQIESLCFSTASGFMSAMNTYTAQNYGAGNQERIHKGFKIGVIYMVILGSAAGLLFFFFAEPLMGIFFRDEYAIAEGANYLHIMIYSQVFICLEAVGSGCYNGIGRTVIPSTASIVFNLIRIPLAFALIKVIPGVSGVWWAITISGILKGASVAGLFAFRIRKESKQNDGIKQG
ncbi:MAG: MATE family efflux transporter [Firmicutes bacterium]|nr:MATE family efflux transporter [Bacillota bacterium]